MKKCANLVVAELSVTEYCTYSEVLVRFTSKVRGGTLNVGLYLNVFCPTKTRNIVRFSVAEKWTLKEHFLPYSVFVCQSKVTNVHKKCDAYHVPFFPSIKKNSH